MLSSNRIRRFGCGGGVGYGGEAGVGSLRSGERLTAKAGS